MGEAQHNYVLQSRGCIQRDIRGLNCVVGEGTVEGGLGANGNYACTVSGGTRSLDDRANDSRKKRRKEKFSDSPIANE